MTRRLRVLLEIDVDDLTPEERARLEDDMRTYPGEPVKLPTLAETTAEEAASVLDGIGTEGVSEMLFEGEDACVRFVGAKVLAAAWRDEFIERTPARELAVKAVEDAIDSYAPTSEHLIALSGLQDALCDAFERAIKRDRCAAQGVTPDILHAFRALVGLLNCATYRPAGDELLATLQFSRRERDRYNELLATVEA